MLALFCCATLPAQEQPGNDFFHWSPAKFDHSGQRNPCKVFIGVGTSSVTGGLKVDYTIDDTPARTYGVQAGDVILALDGVPVSTYSELTRERDKHRQGEAFTLTILRDGNEMKINARFKECSKEEQEQYQHMEEEMTIRMEEIEKRMEEMNIRIAERFAKFETKERPILGVFEDESVSVPGMVIRSVIPGKGAEAAGLQAGDVVTKVDGKSVTGGGTLRAALTGRQPGERVTVIYQRDGQTLQTELILSADRSFYSFKTERDPCAVFIGVYTGENGSDGRGVRVTGIVDGTPAKQSGIQPGDVIIALDDQPVNDHTTLRYERDKHQPGDPFRLTIVREGAEMTIDATFIACPTDKPAVAPTEEVVEVITENPPADNKPTNVETVLSPEVLEAYPNPTVGPLNVRFEAEAVPTTVRIMDASGKAVYTKVLNQFDGFFNERVNLYGNTPGIYMLTVQQGQKTSSKKIVLMPQA